MYQDTIMHHRSPFMYQLGAWIAIDIIIGVLFAIIPVELGAIRQVVAGIQFVAMACTMAVAMRRFLEDF